MIRKLKYALPLAVLFASSCKKSFLDINTSPNDPSTVQVSLLLPGAEKSLGDALAIGSGTNGGLSEILEVYTHQLTTREESDQYGATGSEFYIGTAWPKLYSVSLVAGTVPSEGVLKNLQVIIDEGTAAGNLQYVGIAKILKAYTYSQLVDVFGDVPFSEATQLKEGVTYPKFDDDATIYPQLLMLLDEGIGDLKNTEAANVETPGTDDVIYNGNIDNWIKAANSIKLKLYTQIRKVQDVKAQVAALISEDNLISSTEESFLLPYGPNGATDDRNPGFGDYYASQRSNYISPWFYEILNGSNKRLFTGNQDPRIPYYIYNQLQADDAPREGNQTEYRDGPFVSIYFGSQGPDRDRTQQNTMSVLGMYPVGGKYDDGSGEEVTGTSGTGAAPYRFITYADVLYLQAELMHEGLVAGDAKATLRAAVEESFNQVDYVIEQYVKPSQSVPTLAGTDAAKNYIDKVMTEYDAKPSQQLEIIMTQKWISSFGSAVDQYTDVRRTGYPVLFNPNDPTMAPGGKMQPPINGDPLNPGTQKAVPVQLSRAFPLSLPWYQSELETNPNAPEQKNPSTYKVFWMP